MRSLPNILTLSRIFMIPVIIVALFYGGYGVAGIAFVTAAITDYVDGYLARKWCLISPLGEFLDPVADKLLVASTLMMLAGIGDLPGYSLMSAVIILCREILVSGLREFLGQLQVSLPVSRLGKWKTTLQLFSISFLLFSPILPNLDPWAHIGLFISALLTLITGADYLMLGMKHFRNN